MMLIWAFDAPALLVVLGGTVLGTILRCGLRDCGAALQAVAGLGGSHFDQDEVRKQLAIQIQQISRDGILRARPRALHDSEFDEATDALIGQRSIPALITAHEGHSQRRIAQATAAVRTLVQAAELAPVFGLAGTLISLARMPADGIDRSAFLVAIGMAVHATLYGLIAANLLLMPLASWVERAALAEERARGALIDWLAAQLAERVHEPAAPPVMVGHRRSDRISVV